jgi:hypothetical protein
MQGFLFLDGCRGEHEDNKRIFKVIVALMETRPDTVDNSSHNRISNRAARTALIQYEA